METKGFEPVTSCLQTVLAGRVVCGDFQDFSGLRPSDGPVLVYRILRTILAHPGPSWRPGAFPLGPLLEDARVSLRLAQ